MTRPAEEPGTPLEPPGNRRPREMVTRDRIRLTGLLQKKPLMSRVFFYSVSARYRFGQRLLRFGRFGEQLPHAGDHFAAEQFDHGEPLLVSDAPDCVMEVEAAQAERADDVGDPAR